MSVTIYFQVTDANTQQPIADGLCIATSNGVERTTVTDTEGAASLGDLDSGTYSLQVSAEGYRDEARNGLQLKSYSTTKVAFALDPNND
jgi:Carboxypeptidase regulatory-like domain